MSMFSPAIYYPIFSLPYHIPPIKLRNRCCKIVATQNTGNNSRPQNNISAVPLPILFHQSIFIQNFPLNSINKIYYIIKQIKFLISEMMKYLILAALLPTLLLANRALQYEVGDFDTLILDTIFNTQINQGGARSLLLCPNANFYSSNVSSLQQKVIIKYANRILRIQAVKKIYVNEYQDFYIQLNGIKSIKTIIAAGGEIRSNSLNLLPNAYLQFSGSTAYLGNVNANSNLSIFSTGGALTFDTLAAVSTIIHSSGTKITAQRGSIQNLQLDATGCPSMNFGSLSVGSADLRATGSTLHLNVTNNAQVSATGSTIYITGNARVNTLSKIASQIIHKNQVNQNSWDQNAGRNSGSWFSKFNEPTWNSQGFNNGFNNRIVSGVGNVFGSGNIVGSGRVFGSGNVVNNLNKYRNSPWDYQYQMPYQQQNRNFVNYGNIGWNQNKQQNKQQTQSKSSQSQSKTYQNKQQQKIVQTSQRWRK